MAPAARLAHNALARERRCCVWGDPPHFLRRGSTAGMFTKEYHELGLKSGRLDRRFEVVLRRVARTWKPMLPFFNQNAEGGQANGRRHLVNLWAVFRI